MTVIRTNRRRTPRREAAILIGLTVEERDELRAAAARDDRPLSTWIRHVALREARGVPRPAITEDPI